MCALVSKEAGGARCKLTATQLHELEAVLDAGPGCLGTAGRCWTLVRIGERVLCRFAIESAPMLDLQRAESPYGWAVRRGFRWLQDRFVG